MCVCVSCNSNEVGALGLSLYCNFVFEPVLDFPSLRFPNISYGHETRGIEKKMISAKFPPPLMYWVHGSSSTCTEVHRSPSPCFVRAEARAGL